MDTRSCRGTTAVLDHAQPARRDLIVNAVVEQDHRIRHVLLEPLPRQQALAALACDHGGHAPVFQPPEQPPQFGPDDPVIRQAGEQRFDRVEDDALGPDRLNRVVQPDEQAFEIVVAGFLDLAAFHADIVDGQFLRRDQLRKVKAQRRDVFGDLLAAFLEREKDARLAELQRAIHQERHGQQRLAGSWTAADECRPSGWQAAAGDLVETANPRWCLVEVVPARCRNRQDRVTDEGISGVDP